MESVQYQDRTIQYICGVEICKDENHALGTMSKLLASVAQQKQILSM